MSVNKSSVLWIEKNSILKRAKLNEENLWEILDKNFTR